MHDLFPARTSAVNESIQSKYRFLCHEFMIPTETVSELTFDFSENDIKTRILHILFDKYNQGQHDKRSDFKKWWNGMFMFILYTQHTHNTKLYTLFKTITIAS